MCETGSKSFSCLVCVKVHGTFTKLREGADKDSQGGENIHGTGEGPMLLSKLYYIHDRPLHI